MAITSLPQLPVTHDGLARYIASHPETPIQELMRPYRQFEAQLREMYAQQRNDPILDDPCLNVLPLFTQDTPLIKNRARNLEAETPEEKDKYIMSLPDDKRRPSGSPAVVESLKEFLHNFGVFSESSLAEMDWSNVVVAGSAVVNCLLPVPNEYKKSKRALRQYYHEKFCPASDVDLFLYGLNEVQAIEKMKEIEARIRDAILSEVTVVRTKNAVTICSQYPTRHVQIVLRVYKSISEILTGFDIDCAGAAYDGKQVYCTPRALASYITQINPIDLSRRSPSYENRLSKYGKKNFEVYWPELDRSRVDPTIFERSFQRTLGLARLLVLERLPTTNARDQYLQKRRQERGRPNPGFRYQHRLRGNIKDMHEDEVAEWVDEDEVSNYHTFTIPYGVKFHAKKIEKLCYTRDLLLNAEWNQPKEREVYLHRHPAFFGRVEDIIGDCCGTCPTPKTPEEIEIAEKESEIYISGNVSFRIDDPGRQQIGSFNPLTEDDWTEMAYVGNTARLCQAIVDGDIEHVEDWLAQEGADPNRRDYTGRTPLHLAVISSTAEIVKCLVDHGARLVARLADGRTALHLAASRGDAEIIRILLEKSNSNEEEEEEKQDRRRKTRLASLEGVHGKKDIGEADTSKSCDGTGSDEDSDAELVDDSASDDGMQSVTTGSFVKVGKGDETSTNEAAALDDDQNDPDFYKIDVVAWDSKCSALHLAILGGHCDIVKILCQEFGADVLLPIKIGDGSYSNPNAAILSLVLALALSVDKAVRMAETLLSLGATSSQADMTGVTAFHRYIRNGAPKLIESLWENDKRGLKTAINHVAISGTHYNSSATTPLTTAIDRGDPILVLKLLGEEAKPQIDFDSWLKSAKYLFEEQLSNYESNFEKFQDSTEQPLIVAITSPRPATAIELLQQGADPDTLTKSSFRVIRHVYNRWQQGQAALDVVRNVLHEFREYEYGKIQPTRSPRYFARRNSFMEPPLAPHGTAEFLENFHEGTYQHWLVSTDIAKRFDTYKTDLEYYEKQKIDKGSLRGVAAKREAIKDLISQLEKVEKALEDRGAKTFKQQHPDVRAPHEPSNRLPNQPSASSYSLDFKFNNVTDITEARKCAYIKLFEAAWSGDLAVVKSLTLVSWDADKQEPPLKMAVSDSKGNTPFSLAFLKGHYEVARAILEIVQVQWAPQEEKARFTMDKDEDEDSYEESNAESIDEPEIYKKIIDDQFTIDNIGQVSMEVKSHTLPSTFLDWIVPTFRLCDGKMEDIKRTESLVDFCMAQNDSKGLDFLIDMLTHFTSHEPRDATNMEPTRFYMLPDNHFKRAIKLGRTDMLANAIRRIGAGIPIEHLVNKSGIEIKLKPRYYQGLSVYGKKRVDWANAANAGRIPMMKTIGSEVPPLLLAAINGSLESTEWFMSDAPLRHYLEFGKSKVAKEDPRLKHLNESPEGFDRAIIKWLNAQNDLVIHCAIMAPLGDNTSRLVEYLIRVCPSSLEVKSDQGWTPLYLACLLGRVQFANMLVNAGADQSVKDKSFNNIIHAALTNNPKLDQLRELLALLDPDLRSHMFLQRNHLSHGGDTPLHLWLKAANPHAYTSDSRYYDMYNRPLVRENIENVKILCLLLEYTNGADLGILNGAGDTVLHTAVIRHLDKHVRVILAQKPELLYRENAVGRTPSEIAYDIFINHKAGGLDPMGIDKSEQNIQNMLSRCPQAFVQDESENSGKLRRERTWHVVEEYLAKVDGKRRLISLNEANDVAKRLGENYSWQRYYQKPVTSNEDRDEEKKLEGDDEEKDFVTAQYRSRLFTTWALSEDSEAGLSVCIDCGERHA
ncbi:ankyrin repeat protein [Xylariaceae sp. FL0662B]|nr:ankyrin repeat protein [Xylariaceae sp. FL0662B]